jgi:hypothetical protein
VCSSEIRKQQLGSARQRLLPLKVRLPSLYRLQIDKARGILDGTHEIAQFCVPHRKGTMSLHADIEAAKDTISKIRVLEDEYNFHVALAHDAQWLKAGSDKVLMSLLDAHMLLSAKERIPKEEVA